MGVRGKGRQSLALPQHTEPGARSALRYFLMTPFAGLLPQSRFSFGAFESDPPALPRNDPGRSRNGPSRPVTDHTPSAFNMYSKTAAHRMLTNFTSHTLSRRLIVSVTAVPGAA